MPLPFKRAAVGSTNPAKIEAVRLVLARLAPGCALEAVDVPSGVAAQPIGDQATREGARNRARAALAATGAGVAFGLEGGVLPEPPLVWLLSWVAAVANDGRHGDASGLRMPLPSRSPSVSPPATSSAPSSMIFSASDHPSSTPAPSDC